MNKFSVLGLVCTLILFVFPVTRPRSIYAQAAITATPTGTTVGTAMVTPESTPTTGESSTSSDQDVAPDRVGNILLGAMITLGIIGGGLMILGNWLGRKSGRGTS